MARRLYRTRGGSFIKTYFAISDIHGFYYPMHRSLYKAGFRKTNPDHILIVCGDIFDRGPDSVKVYNFLKSLPRDRRILIRGNHEFLLRDLIARGYPKGHDYHNGTMDTVSQFIDAFGGEDSSELLTHREQCELFKELSEPILDWIFSDEWVNYYEIDKYIFVHSWIPVDTHTTWPLYELNYYGGFTYMENWRELSDSVWEAATWGCPIQMFAYGLYPKGKTMVCGHLTAADFHRYFEHTSAIDFTTYQSDELIGLDAATVRSNFCNVYKFSI